MPQLSTWVKHMLASVGEPPTNGPHCCLNYSIKAGRGKDGVGVPNMRDDQNSLLDWNVAEHGG